MPRGKQLVLVSHGDGYLASAGIATARGRRRAREGELERLVAVRPRQGGGGFSRETCRRFLAPYWGFAIERLTEELHPNTAEGEAPEVPRYEQGRETGSTGDVDFWTSKKVKEIKKSHLNYVVQDSKWEQSAAYHLDGHQRVSAFVKNQGLGFTIPYLHAGRSHDYVPDFIVLMDNGVHLVLETKGYDALEEVKAQAAGRWVAAVNADGRYGEWCYVVAREMNTIPAILEELGAQRNSGPQIASPLT